MKWFKHLSDASEDEFLSEVEELFGLEGYARWWKLLEAIAKQMDQTDRCSATYSWTKWQTILRGKRNKLETFLVHSQNKRKLFLKQTGNILEIKIPKLLELRDNYTKNSQVTSSQEVDVEGEGDRKNHNHKPKYKTPPTPQFQGGVFKNGKLGFINALSSSAVERAKKNAPGWDIYELADIYIEGVKKRGEPDDVNLAFPGWCKKYTKGKRP